MFCLVLYAFRLDITLHFDDTTGNIDAKKACCGAMKLHKKYLKKGVFPHCSYLSISV